MLNNQICTSYCNNGYETFVIEHNRWHICTRVQTSSLHSFTVKALYDAFQIAENTALQALGSALSTRVAAFIQSFFYDAALHKLNSYCIAAFRYVLRA